MISQKTPSSSYKPRWTNSKKWDNLPRSGTLADLYTSQYFPIPHFHLKATVNYLHATYRNLHRTHTLQTLRRLICLEFVQITFTRLAQSCQDHSLSSSLCKISFQLIKQPERWSKFTTPPTGTTTETPLWSSTNSRTYVVLETDCKAYTNLIWLTSWAVSFLLRAGTNCLPTPLNLCRWKIQTDSKCPLCSWPKPTSMYILNECTLPWTRADTHGPMNPSCTQLLSLLSQPSMNLSHYIRISQDLEPAAKPLLLSQLSSPHQWIPDSVYGSGSSFTHPGGVILHYRRAYLGTTHCHPFQACVKFVHRSQGAKQSTS